MKTSATVLRKRSARPYEQIVIEGVTPAIDSGRFPAKAIVGEPCAIEATVFRHGSDRVRVVLRVRRPASVTSREIPMVLVDPELDRWRAEVLLDAPGRFTFTVAAWTDHWASWVHEIKERSEVSTEQPSAEVLTEGLGLLERATAKGDARKDFGALVGRLRESLSDPARFLTVAADPAALDLVARVLPRDDEVRADTDFEVMVDRPLARVGAWYHLSARSQAGTLSDAVARLGAIRDLGFDIVRLAPIHPAGATDQGVLNPWAVGNSGGGHTAIDPALGSIDDFDRFVDAAGALGIEVALDLPFQCAIDHPWIQDHPDWFFRRPDGAVRGNDHGVCQLNFDTLDWKRLWHELREVVRFWTQHGVRIFSCVEPHTKPIGFWSWMIEEIHRESPEVIFLAECFSCPPMMLALGKRGFSQSTSPFIWKTSKKDLTAYLADVTSSAVAATSRPNFFINTPHITPPILESGGAAAFKSRLVLAATLSPSYGIYEGYEQSVSGNGAAGTLQTFVGRVNAARKANQALHRFDNLRLLEVDHDQVLAYVKSTPDRANSVIVVVNLDPAEAHAATVQVPADVIGLATGERFPVEDVLTGRRYTWGGVNEVRLDPRDGEPAHILVVRGR